MTDSSLLVLIDAYSQIFRSFYAIRDLSNAKGEPVNAIYGFCKLLMKLDREYPSMLGAMVFDCGRVNFRLELNPAYKANRKPTPDALKAQVPMIRELTEAFGWALLEEPEFEADDLIAALAQSHTGNVKIISADKDLSQLISPRITQLVPDSQSGLAPRGVAEVMSKFSVPPEAVVDFLAVLGDASDNIPGATGIGEKGAVKLLSFGSLCELFENPDKISDEKLKVKFINSIDRLKININLITLRSDLPERLNNIVSSCSRRTPEWAHIRAICEKCELKSILRTLPEGTTKTPPVTAVQDDLFGNF